MSHRYKALQYSQESVSSSDRLLRNTVQQMEAHLGPEIFLWKNIPKCV